MPDPSTALPSAATGAQLLARADETLFHHAGPFPDLLVEKASGAVIVDRDGTEYLDFTSGQLCATFGHNHPALREAIVSSFARSVHSSSHLLSEEVIVLAEQLVALLPEPLSKVTLLTTGSEATEVGLKAVRMANDSWETIGVTRSYHGHTAGAAAVTFLPRRRGTGPSQPGVHAIPAPYCFRCPLGASYPECGFSCVDVGLGAVDAQRTSDVAALIIEPILSTGGMIDPPDGYFAHLRDRCDQRGIALVLDEAQTGLGRTGDMFAFEAHAIVPDVVALSKSLGGGFPLAAVVLTDEIAKGAEERGFRFLTSHMNEPSMAMIGLAMVALARDHVEAGTARTRGQLLSSGLAALVDDFECVGDARGRGLLLGIEFVTDKQTNEPAPERAKAVELACRRRGLLVQTVSENTWRIAPPLTVTEGEIERALAIIRESLQEADRA